MVVEGGGVQSDGDSSDRGPQAGGNKGGGRGKIAITQGYQNKEHNKQARRIASRSR